MHINNMIWQKRFTSKLCILFSKLTITVFGTIRFLFFEDYIILRCSFQEDLQSAKATLCYIQKRAQK